MRTNATKKVDSHGEYFTDFGIHPEYMSTFGYTNENKYPEVWEVEIEADDNQEDIGKYWNTTEYFGFVPYPTEDIECFNKIIKGDSGGFDENGNPVKFTLIQRNFTCYHIQFPYGYEDADTLGKHYRLKITPIKRLL